jgi:hypothetical protein
MGLEGHKYPDTRYPDNRCARMDANRFGIGIGGAPEANRIIGRSCDVGVQIRSPRAYLIQCLLYLSGNI